MVSICSFKSVIQHDVHLLKYGPFIVKYTKKHSMPQGGTTVIDRSLPEPYSSMSVQNKVTIMIVGDITTNMPI